MTQQHHNRSNSEVDVLAWRRNPEESFSDWTIEVTHLQDVVSHQDTPASTLSEQDETNGIGTSTSSSVPQLERPSSLSQEAAASTGPSISSDGTHNNGRDLYHVHRVFLASGPRKSEYFKTLFSMTMATEEAESQTTRLALHESACLAFPGLLDYVYGGDDGLTSSMTTHSVVALQYLADYLQIPKLVPITTAFIINDLTEETVHLYCHEGLLYGIGWIVQHCIHFAARFPHQLLVSPTTNSDSNNGANHDDGSDDGAAASDSQTAFTEPSSVAMTASPVQQTMAMLPPAEQIQLLQLGLQKSLTELQGFKRMPFLWKENIDDVRATHLPTAAGGRFPRQGSGLPFPHRICPVFFFDPIEDPQRTTQRRRRSVSAGGDADDNIDVAEVYV